MDRGRLKYWLALSRIRGVERSLKDLVEMSGSPEALFKGKGGPGLKGLDTAIAGAFKGFDSWDWVEEEIGRIKGHGARVITYDDPLYPPLLKSISDPPCLLYAKGEVDPGLPTVAVVGTRRPTNYGTAMAEAVSKDLASAGVVVVSGLARGCDRAAHAGALKGGGKTIAVLGTGIDVVYPRENKPLFDEIARKGLIVTELPFGTPPVPQNFPRRNRIISGLSLGVLVVEAPLRSGSLMTAGVALDQGREVFALPGPATSTRSAGTNKLIKDGAALIEGANDILEILSIPRKVKAGKRKAPELKGPEKLIWKALGDEPLHIDAVMEKSGLGPGEASMVLLDMELRGLIEQHPGKRFTRKLI